MTKGYIGKISAIVTVNTADAERAFNKSAADAQKFGANLQRTVQQATRDAGKSFDNIFTPLQKLQRAIQASKSANFNLGIKGLSAEELKRVEQLSLAARQLAAPLASAAKQFDGLGAAVQRGFSPALTATQTELLRVRDSMELAADAGLEGFTGVARQVEKTVAAINQLAEASRQVASLPTGRELAFSDPRLAANLSAAQQAGRNALSLPAGAIQSDPQFSALTQQINRVSELAVAAAARVKGAFSGSEAIAAQRDYDRLNSVIESLVQRLNRRYRLVIDAEQSKKDAQQLKAAIDKIADNERFRITGDFQNAAQMQDELQRVISLRGKLTASQNTRIQPLVIEALDAAASGDLTLARQKIEQLRAAAEAGIEVNVRAEDANRQLDALRSKLSAIASSIGEPSDPIDQLAVAAREADASVRKLGSSLAGLDFGAEIDQLKKDIVNLAAIPAGTLRDQAARTLRGRAADIAQRAGDASQFVGNPQGSSSTPLPPGFRGQADAGLGESLANPLRQLDVLRSGIVSVKGQIDQLPAALRQQFIPAITAAETEFRRLATAPNQSAVAIDVARQRLLALTREAKQASEALNFRRSFGSRDAVVSSLQTQQLRGYTAQIQILEGELAKVTGFARGPAVAAIVRLGTVISEQMRRGTIDTQAGRREIQRYTQDAVRATAAASGINAGALGRTVARAGDVGRQGFANLSLGIQQAAFAFDDFFSVTGGLDQRIRAAGNNISQLGFILGGTAGLIAGISISIGAQLVASIIKWTGVTEDAERRQRELKDALESTNGALERQRQLAEQLRNTYRELAKSIAEAGAPEAFRDERQRREQIAAVQREQEDRRRAGIEANSPQIAQQRGRIAEIDRQLETEQNAATRQRLIERRNAADAAVRREIDDIERRSAQNARVAIERNAGIDGALRDQQGRRDALRGDIGTAARRGNEAEVNRLSRELAVIETTILRLRDASVRLGAERGQDVIGSINRAQANIENVPGIRQLDVFSSVVRTEYERFSNLLKDGQITFQEFNNAQQRMAAVGENAELASAQLGVFADALQSAAGSLARAVEQELRGRVDSQRREANAAEVRFGTNDPRAQLARRQQQQSEELARRGTREREAIDAEISRQRRNFESAALDGRGDAEANRIGERLREIGQALSRQPQDRAEANQQERLRLEADVLRRQLGELFNATPGAQQLNRQANLADIRGQQGIQGQEAVRRGFEASITPAQRAGEELGRTLFDLKSALDDGAVTLEQYNAAVKRNVDEQSRAIAPAIYGLADQVQNAVLQGPSRAALNVSDVSTVEGSRELNRLLRGDDAALQQASLQELQKQSELLREALAVAKEQAAPKVVDLK